MQGPRVSITERPALVGIKATGPFDPLTVIRTHDKNAADIAPRIAVAEEFAD